MPSYDCGSTQRESLDGLVVPGRIRAQGIAGVMSVPGELSFRDGLLVWAARGSEDVGSYVLSGSTCPLEFTAEHYLENNEQVRWSGLSDGRTVSNVTAVWTRNEGDWVHDLFLPHEVTLEFTPDG